MNIIKQPIRISVLMAIYNCADTLSEALDSLFIAQTYQGFKVILCDDSSTDTTYEIAKEYAGKYPDRIILLKNESNMKLPASLNRCLEYADTEYIARMDGDDISKPTRFQEEIDFLDNHPEYAIVSTAMEYFDENGIFMIGKAIEKPDERAFIGSTPHAHAPAVIRTYVIKEVGGYTCKSYTQRGQDVDLCSKIYSRGYKGYNISAALYQMRDDKKAYKRRTLKEAVRSVVRNYKIYQRLGIPFKYYLTIFRPLILCLIPQSLYLYLHKRKFK